MYDEIKKLIRDQRPEDLEKLKEKITSIIDEKIDAFYEQRDRVHQNITERIRLGKVRIGVWKSILANSVWTNIKYLIGMPFIYSMIIPSLILHLFLEVFQHICFRLYNIPRVSPKKYFVFDRHTLPSLNWLDKFNCTYCSYFNGLIAYAKEIGGRTERFWCPIKHARRRASTHAHYKKFSEFGDKNVHKHWEEVRKFEEK